MSEPSQAEEKNTEISSSSIQTTQLHDQSKTTGRANGDFCPSAEERGREGNDGENDVQIINTCKTGLSPPVT